MMSKTIGAILIMAVAAFAGLFLGAYLNDVMGGMIPLSIFLQGEAAGFLSIHRKGKQRLS